MTKRDPVDEVVTIKASAETWKQAAPEMTSTAKLFHLVNDDGDEIFLVEFKNGAVLNVSVNGDLYVRQWVSR